MSFKKSFFKIGIIYTIGQILAKALSFFLLPIYAKQLGTVGYGKLALVDTFMDFISTFLIISIYSGYIRFYREYPKDKRNKLRNTAINFSIILGVLDIIIFILLGKYISKFIFKFENSYQILLLVVIRSLFNQFITMLMCDYNLNYRAGVTVVINLSMLIMNLSMSIFLVVYKKQGIIGVYKGYIYSSIIILIFLCYKQKNRYKLELDRNMLKDMLSFSWGLMPGGISSTILTLADRYILSGYKSYGETGIYSMGYKFGMLIDPLFISPFKSVFTPYKFQICNDNDAEDKFNKMFNMYNVIGCFFILSIALYSKIIISLFISSIYIKAYLIVPIILSSYFLYGKAEFYTLGIQISNKTYLDALVMLLGGLLNIALNIIFIPSYGMYGAAVATVLSYFVMNILYSYISNKYYNLKFKSKDGYKVYGICIFLYLIYNFVSKINNNLLVEFFINIILILLYFIICLKMRIISKSNIYSILIYIKKKKN